MYSHDTCGLGHLTRTRRLAEAVLAAFPACEVVLLSGSSVLNKYHLPARVKPVQLPPVRKLGHEQYVVFNNYGEPIEYVLQRRI